MKKFLPIITGLILGIAVSSAMIVVDKNNIAHSDTGLNWWNDFVGNQDNDLFDWKTVFSPLDPSKKGKNLYSLMYEKAIRKGPRDAIKQVANNYGMTVTQAQAALNGDTTTIFNSSKNGTSLNQGQAVLILQNLQNNFADLSELYQIQQQVDAEVAPSEMFANGDLSDSGFDLVYDLSLIEDMLFLKKTPVSVGGVYADALDSPYNPTVDDKTLKDYIPNEFAVATSALTISDASAAGGAAGKNASGADQSGSTGKIGTINIGGDKKVVAEVLNKDLCPTDNSLNNALSSYDSQNSANANAPANGNQPVGAANAGLPADNSAAAGGEKNPPASNPPTPAASNNPLASTVVAAPASDWTKEWCAGENKPGVDAGIGASGFKSLGGVNNNYIAGGNASANYDSKGFAAKIGICFDIKLIPKMVSSFLPGDTCILCEVQKINEFMAKTLSHTLTPNKATGNLMETAKCKTAASAPLINLQFITIWNPIPTPPNDKLIFGRNIFDEWNKYVETYYGKANYPSDTRPDLTDQFNAELEAKTAPSVQSQSEVISSINKIKAKAAADASLSLDNSNLSQDVSNTMVYSRNVLREIQQMNNLFQNFKNTYTKINTDALEKIVNKKDING